VYSFAVSPDDPQLLLAGTVEAIYRSTDRGESWRMAEGLREQITTFSLLSDPADSSILYAGTTDGVYRSTDGGQTWTPRRAGMGEITVTTLAAEPGTGALYAGTEHRGLWRSGDGGQLWTAWGLENNSVYALVVDEATGAVWVATDEGVFKGQP
jgi:photosystem II stability/assembly factor-like uncharacterized protein